MIRKLLATDDSAATAILRLVLGVVFFAHGAQRVFGWFGDGGFEGTPLLGFVAIIAGFCGGLGLIIGLLGHVSAFGILVNMIVAVAIVHSRVGFS